jgi:hypothetical protein
MQNFIRKHRKLLGWFIVLVIGVPMVVFFGLPSGAPSNGSMTGETIVEVGGQTIEEAEFRQSLNNMLQRNPQAETLADLDTAQVLDVLKQLTQSALLKVREDERGFGVRQAVLQDRMKQWSDFQNDQGEFDPTMWNAWVQQYDQSGRSWDELYGSLGEGISREVLLNTIWAKAGRVKDSVIREEVKDDFTTFQVKYAKIAPEASVDRERVEAYYEENKENFREEDAVKAQFVKLPYVTEVPALALDMVKRAREGDEFAKLADEFSDFDTRNGGEMGWLNPETAGPLRQAALALEVGEVSEPVSSSDGYYIYKVENERFVDADGNVIGEEQAAAPESEEAAAADAEGQDAEAADAAPEEEAETPAAAADVVPDDALREVFARQIFIRSALDETGRQEIADLGTEIAERSAELHEIAKDVRTLTDADVDWAEEGTELASRAGQLATLAQEQAASAEGDAAQQLADVQTAAAELQQAAEGASQPAVVGEQAEKLAGLAQEAKALLGEGEAAIDADIIANWAEVRRRAAVHIAGRERGDVTDVDLSGIREAAAEFGLELFTTDDFFSRSSTEIDAVAPLDVTEFRGALTAEDGSVAPYNVIRARENVYVASVSEVLPGDIPPLDDIYAEVEEGALAEYKRGDAYQEQVTALIEEIKEKGLSLDQIAEQYPNLEDFTVATSEEINRSEDFWVGEQVFISTRQLFDQLDGVEPGTVVGPVNYAIGGDLYAVELVSMTQPTEEELAEKEDAFDSKKEQRIAQRQNQLLMDYLDYLYENMLPSLEYNINYAAVSRILGYDLQERIQSAEQMDPLG